MPLISTIFTLSFLGSPDPRLLDDPKKFHYFRLILDAAETLGEDPLELLAIAYVETKLNANVISKTGDVGLLQVNCKIWYKRLLYSSLRVCEKALLEPATNIRAAIHILNNHARKYKHCKHSKNRYRCYNGGPGWMLAKHSQRAKKYADAVMRYYFIFKQNYENMIEKHSLDAKNELWYDVRRVDG